MTYLDFLKEKPILYGSITVNSKEKLGFFKPKFNRYSNNIEYQYYTLNGNIGKGGFTMLRAFNLLNINALKLAS